jgi:hypothetical protein
VKANTHSSKKAKGKRLEQAVAKAYRQYEVDETARPMPMSGAMTHFKGDVFKQNDYMFVDECKNTERIKFWDFWEQAVSQASNGRKPVLHVSANHRPIVTCISLEDYMDMRKSVLDLENYVNELERRLDA